MTINYTTNLGLGLPVTGTESGLWGDIVNNQITSLVDTAISGTTSVAVTTLDVTLTATQGAANQARSMVITLTGASTAARNVICPAVSKIYIVRNATTGGFAHTFKTSAGTGISVPNGREMLLYCDGTNVLGAIDAFSSSTDALVTVTGGAGYGAFGAYGSGTNNANHFFGNVTNGERTRFTVDNARIFYISNNSGTTNHMTLDASGNLTAAANVTAYSDERLKTDWQALGADFIEQLAKVKHGTYTRTDINERQIGVSAQSLQSVAPEGVLDGEHLSVAYGNVALAAAVELAKRVVELEARLAALEA